MKVRQSLILLLLCLGNLPLFAQPSQWIKTDSIYVGEVHLMDIDRFNNLFIANSKGQILKYNDKLVEKGNFSPAQPVHFSSWSVWNGLNILAFVENTQTFSITDRFLSRQEQYQFPQDIIGFAQAAALSYDNQVWVLDQYDFSIKKYNATSRVVELVQNVSPFIPNINEVHRLMEYQNKLYALTSNEAYVFDLMLNYELKITHSNSRGGRFFEDKLYSYDKGKLIVTNLYSLKTDVLELEMEAGNVIYLGDRLIVSLDGYCWLYQK